MNQWRPRCPFAGGLVRPVRVDPAGVNGPTRGEAAGPRWRRTSYGFYVPADAPRSVEQRIIEQAVRLPTGGAVTGWAACRLHRAGLIDGLARDGRTPLPVPLAVGRRGRLRTSTDALLLHDPLDAGEIVVRYGVPTVTELRAAFDATRFVDDPREAVVMLDAVLAARLTSLQRFREYVAARPGRHHVGLARFAAEHASEESLSPYESRLRLLWVLDARLPAPALNREIRDGCGRAVGVVDLLDEVAGLAVEFDGADHRSRSQHARDVVREDALRRLGIEVVHVTAADMDLPERVVDRIRSARGRAAFEPLGERRWTAHRWLADGESVLARRAGAEERWSEPVPTAAEMAAWR